MAINARVEFIKFFRTIPIIKNVISCDEMSSANTTVESFAAPSGTEAVRIVVTGGAGYARVGATSETVDTTNGLYLNSETESSAYIYAEEGDIVLISST